MTTNLDPASGLENSNLLEANTGGTGTSSGGRTTGGSGGGGGIPAAHLRQSGNNALGLFIGLGREGAGPDWALRGVVGRDATRATWSITTGGQTFTITLPDSLAEGAAGNNWSFRRSASFSTSAWANAGLRIVNVSARHATITFQGVHDALVALDQFASSDITFTGDGTTSFPFPDTGEDPITSNFSGGVDGVASGPSIDAANKTVSITYKADEILQAIVNLVDGVVVETGTTLYATEIHGTNLLALPETAPFDNRPFDEYFSDGSLPNTGGVSDYNDLTNKPTLGTAAAEDVGTDSGDVPQLGAGGKLPTSIIPDSIATDQELADAIAALVLGAKWTTGTAAPTGGANGDWYLRTGNTNPGIYYRSSGSWTRVLAPATGSGGGITLDEARDAAGALMAQLADFSYDPDTNTIFFNQLSGGTTFPGIVELATQAEIDSERNPGLSNAAKRVMDIPGVFRAIARKVKVATNTVRGQVLLARNEDVDATETDLTRVPTIANVKRLLSRLFAANPSGVRTGALEAITINGVNYYIATDLGISNRDADSLDVTSSSGRDVTIPSATETQAGLLSAADKQNIDDAHDSSGGTAPDNRRLTALEQRVVDIELIPHVGWVNATTAEFAIVSVDNFSTDQADVLNLTYGTTAVAAADGSVVIILKIPHGNSPNSFRIQRAGSSTAVVHGVFHGGGFTQGGDDYVYMAGSLALVTGDTLTLQAVGTVYTTRYKGELTRLDEHAALTYVHQDNPVRVSVLPVGAPTGRQVYLTEAATHPNENIFSVPVRDLGDFYGATVADFTSIGGPAAATDQAGYPAIMNVARISGVWQHKYIRGNLERRIYVAVRGSIGTPTHIHIAPERGSGLSGGGGLDERFTLEVDPDNPAITVGGVVNRVMRTPVLTYDFLQSLALDNPPNPLSFSLQYDGGFLDDDGTIDSGVDHAVGHYESLGTGQWESRGEAILNNLAAMLETASVATKQRLLDALSYEEELHRTNVARNRAGWNELAFNRDIVAADDNKTMVIRFKNATSDITLELNAGEFRNHTPQASGARRTANTGSFIFVIPDGDQGNRDEVGRTLLFVSRPSSPPGNANRIMMLSRAFGTSNDQWRVVEITITLRGF